MKSPQLSISTFCYIHVDTYIYSLVHNKILVLTWVLAYSYYCLSILHIYKNSLSELHCQNIIELGRKYS